MWVAGGKCERHPRDALKSQNLSPAKKRSALPSPSTIRHASRKMPWAQNYDPLHSLLLSALVASVPVVLLLALLAFWHVRAHLAALAGLGAALATAIFIFKMPAPLALASAGYGAAFGLFPIGWIVLNAVFIYQLAVETGTFEQLKSQIASLSSDRRIQALLIAFSFGAFVEGCAGFGAPVAISGAMLIGLGFKPLEAAKLALIGNTAPVAFGSVGIPITTLASVTGLDVHALSSMVGRQLPFFSLLVPFWLVAAMAGWRGMLAVWPACLVCGASFGIVQFLVSNFHGPWLVDIAAATASMLATVALLAFWHPASAGETRRRILKVPSLQVDPKSRLRAWLPWVMLAVAVALWKVAPIERWLKGAADFSIEVPLVFNGVQKVPVVVNDWQVTPIPGGKLEFEAGKFSFQILAMTGTALLIAGVLSGLLLGVRPGAIARTYWHTVRRVRISLLTIALMLALGYTTRYGGTDTTMGLAFAATGPWFPFFSPMLGWLGVALTGSDTSSNVLFGNLQKVTAEQTGLSPILTCGSNSSGGVMGKMIDAQSIVVAQTATGDAPGAPDAGTILRAVFWHSLALAILVGVLVWLQARVFPWMIPAAP
jgi:lactate permease